MIRALTIFVFLLATSWGHAQSIKSFTPALLYSGVATPGGATFQGQNRLAVKTSRGCYFTHIHDMVGTSLSEGEIAALWFSPTCDPPFTLIANYGPYGGGAPSVLADISGSVYWLIANQDTSNLYVAKYGCGPSPTCIDLLAAANYPNYASTKWTAMFAECYGLGSIFVASFFPAVNFTILNRDLSVYDHYQVTRNGSISGLEYPFLEHSCPTPGSGGTIALGWATTAITATSPGYDGIHYMLNTLNGHSGNWINPTNGVGLSIPVISDDTGPTPEMRAGFTPPPPNSVWLGAFALTNGWNAHFAYASPNGPSPTTETEQTWRSAGGSLPWGRLALHDNLLQGGASSKVGGATLTIQELRGSSSCYFKGGDGNLYLMGPSQAVDTNGKNWLVALKSTDDGITWTDFAQSTNTFNVYALNCMREGIETGANTWANGDEIIGIFTNFTATPVEIYTFHVPIAP